MSTLSILQSKINIIQTISDVFNEQLIEQIARDTGFIQRERVLSGADFLRMCIFACQQDHKISLEGLCADLLTDNKYIARQSLQERFNERSVAFIQQVFQCALSQKLDVAGITNDTFGRIIVSDSTKAELPEHFCEKYPGSGGGASKASLKLQYSYDLLSANPVTLVVQQGNHPDNRQALMDIVKNDLILEDQGYFVLNRFKQIAQQGAFFLSRLKFNISVYTKHEDVYLPLDLLQEQQNMRPGQSKAIDAYLGHNEKLAVRLIIERVPDNIAAEKRRKLKTDKQNKRRNLSARRLALCNINAYITNTSELQIPTDKINNYYRLRWQVEIIFKAWKSVYNIDKVKGMKIERFECMTYAGLLLILLTTRLLTYSKAWLYNHYKVELSEFKFFRTIKVLLVHIRGILIKHNHLLNDFINKLLFLLRKTTLKDQKRLKKSPFNILQIA